MRFLTPISLFPLLTLALPSTIPTKRQQNTTTTFQEIGTLHATIASAPYILGDVVYDPSEPYGHAPVPGLVPAASAGEYTLDYSVRNGAVRAGSDFGGEAWFLVPATTALVNLTDAAGASSGFSYDADAGGLLYLGVATSWFGCDGLQTDGAKVLYLQIDGVVPSDGVCEQVTLMGAVAAK